MPIDNSTRFPKPLAADLRELSEGMAIVIDGDTAPKAIASGQYLFIKNHSTLATGGYHATAAIASGADITSSNVTPDADGIVNGAVSALSEQIGNNCKPVYHSFTAQATHNIACPVAGSYFVIARANAGTVSSQAVLSISIQGQTTARTVGSVGGNCVCTWYGDVAKNATITVSSSNMSTDSGYFHLFAFLLKPTT